MANRRPVAIPSVYCTDLIKYILQSHSIPTTLVVCSSREAFLEYLQATIHHTHPIDTTEPPNGGTSKSPHPFLIPTIHLLATSRTVALAFTPTLLHLRAYLATFNPSAVSAASAPIYENPGTRTPTLAILGLITLHQSTSEHSAQGLSRTLANAVEAAERAKMRLLLAEPRSLQENEEMLGMGDTTSEVLEMDRWAKDVPLLNNSIRVGSGERAWAGRTIKIAKVIEGWCRFVTLEEIGLI